MFAYIKIHKFHTLLSVSEKIAFLLEMAVQSRSKKPKSRKKDRFPQVRKHIV